MARHEFTEKGSAAHRITPQEARKGGKASARARKQKKTMAEIASLIGQAQVADPKARASLEAAGIANDDITNSALVVYGIFWAAVNGDMKAVDKWQQLTEGIVPQSESTVHIVMDSSIEELSE